jgi:hypothetical protein
MSKYHLNDWKKNVSFNLRISNHKFYDNSDQNVQNIGAVVSRFLRQRVFAISPECKASSNVRNQLSDYYTSFQTCEEMAVVYHLLCHFYRLYKSASNDVITCLATLPDL